jgi:hypothetical protein
MDKISEFKKRLAKETKEYGYDQYISCKKRIELENEIVGLLNELPRIEPDTSKEIIDLIEKVIFDGKYFYTGDYAYRYECFPWELNKTVIKEDKANKKVYVILPEDMTDFGKFITLSAISRKLPEYEVELTESDAEDIISEIIKGE